MNLINEIDYNFDLHFPTMDSFKYNELKEINELKKIPKSVLEGTLSCC